MTIKKQVAVLGGGSFGGVPFGSRRRVVGLAGGVADVVPDLPSRGEGASGEPLLGRFLGLILALLGFILN